MSFSSAALEISSAAAASLSATSDFTARSLDIVGRQKRLFTPGASPWLRPHPETLHRQHQRSGRMDAPRGQTVLPQSAVYAVRHDADDDQRHGGALAEGQQVEEGGGVRGRLEGVEKVQQRQGADHAADSDRRAAAPLGLGVEGRVQAQAQAEQGAHVAQEAGEGRGVQVDPLGPHAPPLGFVQSPQQVHAQRLEDEVEAHGEGGQEERRVEVLPHAGAVDPLSSVEGLAHDHPCNASTR
ncbi:hypothetical protein EYF80_004832 [Liparis tanakae]|uniref:Uncharacterized protein n=1 Tax=Liparis tanakae TaxID=230148 RepID=A0A4Z2J435_9TELE|nr:hypothetical protein EYF80_004832 [Liparis tanakae]